MDILSAIPESIYGKIGMVSLAMGLVIWKFELWKWVKISPPENFMRQFRWLTPVGLLVQTIVLAILSFQIWQLSKAIELLGFVPR
jgi:hypothetical protein